MSVHLSEFSTTQLVVNLGFMLFWTGIGAWFLTRPSQEAARLVRLREEWGYPVTDHVRDVIKYTKRVWIFYFCFVVLGILGVLVFGVELMHRYEIIQPRM